MKRLFIVCFLCSLVSGLGLIAPAQEDITPPPVVHSQEDLLTYVRLHGAALDAASKARADQVVRDVTQHWALDTLTQYIYPQQLTPKAKEAWQTLLKMFAQELGPLKSYQGSQGEAKLTVHPQGRVSITAHYTSAITCQHGKAKVEVTMLRFGSTWYVTEFSVSSDLAFLGHG